MPTKIASTPTKKTETGDATGSKPTVTVRTRDTSGTAEELEKLRAELEDVKRGASKLEYKANLFEGLVMGMSDSVMMLNTDLFITMVNPAALSLTGWEAEDLLGKSMLEVPIMPPEFRDAMSLDDFRTQLSAAGRFSAEVKLIRKDGSTPPFLHSIGMIKDVDGEPLGAVIISRDISDLKNVVKQQKISVSHFEGMVNGLPDIVIKLDSDFVVTAVNPAMEALLGWSEDEVTGKTITELPHIDKETRGISGNNSLIENFSQSGTTTEMGLIHKDGQRVPFLCTMIKLADPKGRSLGAVMVSRDISTMKKALEEQKDSLAFFEGVINSISDAVTIMDSDLRITDVNPAMERLQGWTPKEVLGKLMLESPTITPELRDAISNEEIHDHILSGEVGEADQELLHKDGRRIMFRCSPSPIIDADGNFLGLINIARDMSKEVQAVNDILELVESAVSGQLDIRADADKYEGNFQKIIACVNDLMNAVVGPISETRDLLEKIAANDLSIKMDGDYQGEYAAMRDALNIAIDNLAMLVGQIKSTSNNLADSAGEFANAAEQSGLATQSIASTIQEVAQDVEEQSRNIAATNAAMGQLDSAVEGIAVGTQEQAQEIMNAFTMVQQVSGVAETMSMGSQAAAEGSRQSSAAAKIGAEKVKGTVDGMQKIMNAMETVSERVTHLGNRSKEIGKIVATIDDIAAQTNLLALNAAIEAARAGEQGRGFAVVADEVRKLAERSSMATKEIADLVSGIQQGVDEAVSAMEQGNRDVEAGNAMTVEAGDALEAILTASDAGGEQIEQLAAAAEELNATSQELVKVIDSLNGVVEKNSSAAEEMTANSTEVAKSLGDVAESSERNSAKTEEISAATEEMTAQIEEVIVASQAVSGMASDMQNSVSMFILPEE